MTARNYRDAKAALADANLASTSTAEVKRAGLSTVINDLLDSTLARDMPTLSALTQSTMPDVDRVHIRGGRTGVQHDRIRVEDGTEWPAADVVAADGSRWRVTGREVDARLFGISEQNDHYANMQALQAAFDFASAFGRVIDLRGLTIKIGAPDGSPGLYCRDNVSVRAEGATLLVAFNGAESSAENPAFFMQEDYDTPVSGFRWRGGTLKRDDTQDDGDKLFWEGNVIYLHGNDNLFEDVAFIGYAAAEASGGGRGFQGGGTWQEALSEISLTSGDSRITLPSSFVMQPQDYDLRVEIPGAVSGEIERINVTNAGSGYSSSVTASISGGGGSGATLQVLRKNDGTIDEIVVTNPGSGYSSSATVVITDGTGTGAAATEIVTNTMRGWVRDMQFDDVAKQWSFTLVGATGATKVPTVTTTSATGWIDRCGNGTTFRRCRFKSGFDNTNHGSAVIRITHGGGTVEDCDLDGGGDAPGQACPLNRDSRSVRGVVFRNIRRAGGHTGRMILISSGGSSTGNNYVWHDVSDVTVENIPQGYSGANGIRIAHNGGTLGKLKRISLRNVTQFQGGAAEGGSVGIVVDSDKDDGTPVEYGSRLIDKVYLDNVNVVAPLGTSLTVKGRLGEVWVRNGRFEAPRTSTARNVVISSDSVRLFVTGNTFEAASDADIVGFNNGGDARVRFWLNNFTGIPAGKAAISLTAKAVEVQAMANNFEGAAGGYAFRAGINSDQLLRIEQGNTYSGVSKLLREGSSISRVIDSSPVTIPATFADGNDATARLNAVISEAPAGATISLGGFTLTVAGTINIDKRITLDFAGGSIIGTNQYAPLIVVGPGASYSTLLDVDLVGQPVGGRVDPSGYFSSNYLGGPGPNRCSALVIHGCNYVTVRATRIKNFAKAILLRIDTSTRPNTDKDYGHDIRARNVDDCDFGVLMSAQYGARIDIQGKNTTAYSLAAPHMVYVTENDGVWSEMCELRVESEGNPFGTAVKIKSGRKFKVWLRATDVSSMLTADSDTAGLRVLECIGYGLERKLLQPLNDGSGRTVDSPAAAINLNGTTDVEIESVSLTLKDQVKNLGFFELSTSADDVGATAPAKNITIRNAKLNDTRQDNTGTYPFVILTAEDVTIDGIEWNSPLTLGGTAHNQWLFRVNGAKRVSISNITAAAGSSNIYNGTGTTESTNLVLDGDKLRGTGTGWITDNATGVGHRVSWRGRCLRRSTKSADYTLTWADNGNTIKMNSTSPLILTLPVLPLGTRVAIIRNNTGTMTFAAGTGSTIRSPGGILAIANRYGETIAEVVDHDPVAVTSEWFLKGGLT